MYRLYHFLLSPFSRKVRLCMAEKGLEVGLIEERYWDPSPEFIRLNPLRQVPILRANGHIISGSQAICEFLEETHPDPSLLFGTAAERAEIRRIINWFDDCFYHNVTRNLLDERLLKKIKGAGQPDSRAVTIGMKNIKRHLDDMDQLLDQRKWLAGDLPSLADFAAAGQLSCLDYIGDVDWNRHDSVRDWYAKLKSRKAFRGLLGDYLPGFLPQNKYADLDF